MVRRDTCEYCRLRISAEGTPDHCEKNPDPDGTDHVPTRFSATYTCRHCGEAFAEGSEQLCGAPEANGSPHTRSTNAVCRF